MTTINVANTTSAKITRAQAMTYAIEHLTDAPQDIIEVLEKIQTSFTKKPATNGPSKTEIENRKLATAMGQYVISHFDENNPGAINARTIADNVMGINTTQKVSAVAKYADDVQRIKINGRVAYVPSSVEVINE